MADSTYNALINSNAVIEFDPEGNILWANKNYLDLIGYKLSDIEGFHHSIFLKEDERDTLAYHEMWRRLALGDSFTGEFCRVNRLGENVWIQGSYNPVLDSQAQVIKVVKMAVDITDRMALSENLEKKNRELATTAAKAKAATYAKSVFLANMSHEIRTPLNSIIGITDTLAETSLDPQQLTYVEILQRANQQLMTIINDILDLSKVEAGEMEIKKFPFELGRLLQELDSLLNFRAQEKALSLKIEVAPEVESFFIGDANRLRQVLMNLLNNAIKFTHHGGVTLKISHNQTEYPGYLLFCIQDTGIGISKQNFRGIFKPFTQADSTTTRRYGGSGLGLSITKNIVQLMQGHIWLESELNEGSRFYFTLDLEPTIDPQSPSNFIPDKSDLPGHLCPLSGPLKILIVDDVDDNRNLFGIYLRNTPHELTFACSGLEAVTLAAEQSFDIIFMDVQMPSMDGYEATRQIRVLEKSSGSRAARIFACTANAFSEDIAKSLQAGCDMHLSKPIRKDNLLKTVSSYFQSDSTAYLSAESPK